MGISQEGQKRGEGGNRGVRDQILTISHCDITRFFFFCGTAVSSSHHEPRRSDDSGERAEERDKGNGFCGRSKYGGRKIPS